MSEKIRVVIKRTGEPIEVATIDNDLGIMQEIVGGQIEIPYNTELPKGVDLVCNDEGKFMDFEPNIYWGDSDVIYGNIFCMAHDENGEAISLTDEQVEQAKLFIAENDASNFQDYSEIITNNSTVSETFKEFLSAIFNSDESDFDDYESEYANKTDDFEM